MVAMDAPPRGRSQTFTSVSLQLLTQFEKFFYLISSFISDAFYVRIFPQLDEEPDCLV
jgi:hypothetical protein